MHFRDTTRLHVENFKVKRQGHTKAHICQTRPLLHKPNEACENKSITYKRAEIFLSSFQFLKFSDKLT